MAAADFLILAAYVVLLRTVVWPPLARRRRGRPLPKPTWRGRLLVVPLFVGTILAGNIVIAATGSEPMGLAAACATAGTIWVSIVFYYTSKLPD